MEGYEELVFLIEGEGRARALENLLLGQQVPVYVHEELRDLAGRSFHAVAVPPDFGAWAANVIQYGIEEAVLRREGDLVLVLTTDDPLAASAEDDAALLPEAVAPLMEKGEEAVSELVELMLDGDEEVAIAASSALARHREPALEELGARWEEALREKNERHLALVLAACRSLDHAPPRFHTLFENADATLRAFAFRMAADLGMTDAASYLMNGLRDPEEAVREEAVELVFRLTGTDHGFDPLRTPEKNGRALERIAAWLERSR